MQARARAESGCSTPTLSRQPILLRAGHAPMRQGAGGVGTGGIGAACVSAEMYDGVWMAKDPVVVGSVHGTWHNTSRGEALNHWCRNTQTVLQTERPLRP
jgi:hypothetical protein